MLDEPLKITTAGGYQLDGIVWELLRGNVVYDNGAQGLVQLSCLAVPGLERSLFLVKQAAHNDMVPIFDMDNPRWEASDFTFPL